MEEEETVVGRQREGVGWRLGKLQTGCKINRQSDRQTNKQAASQAGRQTDR